MKALRILMGLVAVAVMVSCQDDDSIDVKERKSIELTRAEEQWANESQDFAFRLFRQANLTETQRPNWMISPFSASMALGMLANGAQGNTLEEMKTTLGFSQFEIDGMNQYYRKIATELVDLDNTTQLNIANSIWVQEGFPVYDTFTEVNRDMYDAEVNHIDFWSDGAADIINDWCADKTNGNITKVYDSSPSGTQTTLLNALYFKGIWKKKFKKANTKDEDFNNADGSIVKVPMMNQEESFSYIANEDFHMVDFPYGNGAFSMAVFLPTEGNTLEDVIDRLTHEYWEEWYFRRESGKMKIKLPRFEMEYQKDLVNDLRALGMNDAFNSDRADFTALSQDPVLFNVVQQFTVIRVDEDGTEAAAVTQMKGDAAIMPRLSTFYVDRPFVFMIREISTDTILFMGKVTKL